MFVAKYHENHARYRIGVNRPPLVNHTLLIILLRDE